MSQWYEADTVTHLLDSNVKTIKGERHDRSNIQCANNEEPQQQDLTTVGKRESRAICQRCEPIWKTNAYTNHLQYVRKETLLDQTPVDTMTAFKVFATAEW